MKDYLLNVKVNNTNLFIESKQGVGKHSKDIIIIPNPAQKIEVKKWISKEYSTAVKVEGKVIYSTIFLLYEDK